MDKKFIDRIEENETEYNRNRNRGYKLIFGSINYIGI